MAVVSVNVFSIWAGAKIPPILTLAFHPPESVGIMRCDKQNGNFSQLWQIYLAIHCILRRCGKLNFSNIALALSESDLTARALGLRHGGSHINKIAMFIETTERIPRQIAFHFSPLFTAFQFFGRCVVTPDLNHTQYQVSDNAK